MTTRFQDIWGRLIAVCVEKLPWDALVDFRAREWPAANAGKRPGKMGMADYTELSSDVHTEMQVTLRSRKVELVFFPSSEMWHVRGYVSNGLHWDETQSWSPLAGGKTSRGQEKLEALAEVAFTWLTEGKGADYGRRSNRDQVQQPLASVDGQAASGGLPVG
jgi:hypothetical protein